MASLELKFTHGGSGTKEDPFRVPVVSPVNAKEQGLSAEFIASANHGPQDKDLYIIGFRTDTGLSVGTYEREMVNGQYHLQVRFFGREFFPGEVRKVFVRAIKYKEKRDGRYLNSYTLLDQSHLTPDGWSGAEYWVTTFTEGENEEYLKQFVKEEVVEQPIPETKVVAVICEEEMQVDDVLDNIDDFDLTELQELIDALEAKLDDLKGAIDVKETQLATEVVEVEPVDVYEPVYTDGLNFNVSGTRNGNEIILQVDLEGVPEIRGWLNNPSYPGFASFQFDIPSIDGVRFVELLAEGTYFDKTPENDGSFDAQKVINGWTWRGFDSNNSKNWLEKNPHRLRVGGFTSRDKMIKHNGTLARIKFEVKDGAEGPFTFDFIKVKIGQPSLINPENPRVVVD